MATYRVGQDGSVTAGTTALVQPSASSSLALHSVTATDDRTGNSAIAMRWSVRRVSTAGTMTSQTPELFNTRSAAAAASGSVSASADPTLSGNPLVVMSAFSAIGAASGLAIARHWNPPNPRYPIVVEPSDRLALFVSESGQTQTSNLLFAEPGIERAESLRGRRSRESGYFDYAQENSYSSPNNGNRLNNPQSFVRLDPSAWDSSVRDQTFWTLLNGGPASLNANASTTVTPVNTATRLMAATRAASTTVTPVNTATYFIGRVRAASSVIAQAITATRLVGFARAASVTQAIANTASRLVAAARSASSLLTSPASITASGNEITDVTRVANTNGDGASVPNGYGIWQTSINLCPNGGFETNTSLWTAGVNATLTRITTDSFFGSACGQLVVSGTGNRYIEVNGGAGDVPRASTSNPLSVQARVKVTSGSPTLTFRIYDHTFTTILAQGIVGTPGNTWSQITFSATAAQLGTETTVIVLLVSTDTANATILIDGFQVEEVRIPTPYIETNGSTQSRSAARVQMPNSLLSSGQFWVYFRIRSDASSTNISTTASQYPEYLFWPSGNNYQNSFQLYFLQGNLYFEVDDTTPQSANQAVSWNAGDHFSIGGYTTASQLAVSFNGGAWTTASRTKNPTGLLSLFDIGSASFDIGAALDQTVLWMVCGTGTLTNSDAATLSNQGDICPSVSVLDNLNSGAGAWTARWDARNATYSTPTTESAIALASSGRPRSASVINTPANTVARLVGAFRNASAVQVIATTATRLLAAFRNASVTQIIATTAVYSVGRPRAASVTQTITNTATRLVAFSRNASSVIVIANTAVRLVAAARSASSTIVIANTASRLVAALRNASTVVTPSNTATTSSGRIRNASVTQIIANTATRVRGVPAAASTTVTPANTASRIYGAVRNASVVQVIANTATRLVAASRTAFSTITIANTATILTGYFRSGSVTNTPANTATAFPGRTRTASVTQTIANTASDLLGYSRAASSVIVIVTTATRRVTMSVSASVTITISNLATRIYGAVRNASTTVTPANTATAVPASGSTNYNANASSIQAIANTATRLLAALRSASSTITPVTTGNRTVAANRTASVTQTILNTATRLVGFGAPASVTQTPNTPASRLVAAFRNAASTLTSGVSAGSSLGHPANGSVSQAISNLASRSVAYLRTLISTPTPDTQVTRVRTTPVTGSVSPTPDTSTSPSVAAFRTATSNISPSSLVTYLASYLRNLLVNPTVDDTARATIPRRADSSVPVSTTTSEMLAYTRTPQETPTVGSSAIRSQPFSNTALSNVTNLVNLHDVRSLLRNGLSSLTPDTSVNRILQSVRVTIVTPTVQSIASLFNAYTRTPQVSPTVFSTVIKIRSVPRTVTVSPTVSTLVTRITNFIRLTNSTVTVQQQLRRIILAIRTSQTSSAVSTIASTLTRYFRTPMSFPPPNVTSVTRSYGSSRRGQSSSTVLSIVNGIRQTLRNAVTQSTVSTIATRTQLAEIRTVNSTVTVRSLVAHLRALVRNPRVSPILEVRGFHAKFIERLLSSVLVASTVTHNSFSRFRALRVITAAVTRVLAFRFKVFGKIVDDMTVDGSIVNREEVYGAPTTSEKIDGTIQ